VNAHLNARISAPSISLLDNRAFQAFPYHLVDFH
jgi:hypothetical protein